MKNDTENMDDKPEEAKVLVRTKKEKDPYGTFCAVVGVIFLLFGILQAAQFLTGFAKIVYHILGISEFLFNEHRTKIEGTAYILSSILLMFPMERFNWWGRD